MAEGDTGFFLLSGFSAFLLFVGLCFEGFRKLRMVFYTIKSINYRTYKNYDSHDKINSKSKNTVHLNVSI